jgi:hypothetical protein
VSNITLFAKTNFRGEGKIFGLKKATPQLHLTQKTPFFLDLKLYLSPFFFGF